MIICTIFKITNTSFLCSDLSSPGCDFACHHRTLGERLLMRPLISFRSGPSGIPVSTSVRLNKIGPHANNVNPFYIVKLLPLNILYNTTPLPPSKSCFFLFFIIVVSLYTYTGIWTEFSFAGERTSLDTGTLEGRRSNYYQTRAHVSSK